MRPSSLVSTAPLSAIANSGTTTAKAGMRSVRPAKNALAATAVTPGGCGIRRVATSKITRKITRPRSIHRSARGFFDCIAVIPLPAGLRVLSIFRHAFPACFSAQPGEDNGEQSEPVGNGGRARLQDQRHLDLAQPAGGDRGNGGKARPRRDLGRHEFLAAPGTDDDVGPRGGDVGSRPDTD